MLKGTLLPNFMLLNNLSIYNLSVTLGLGFETSSTTAAHCLYELAIHHDMQEQVRKEIFSQLGEKGDLTYDNLNEMPYLHKVVCGKRSNTDS